ncbi:glycosyltransferase family 2 protein [Corynebacterium aquatimens]|nr:glycosyltransferase family 2 protein [Corynebacterium aquatimens]
MSRPLDLPPVVQQPPRRAGISVIVPSYRGGEQLRTALESVVAQTIDHSDIEVVVVDNGPEAPARDVVEGLRNGVDQDGITWVYIRSETPGAGRARNIGLAACTREYVTFLDDDDRIEPEYLSQLKRAAEPQTIAITGITNMHESGAQPSNTLEDRIAALPRKSTELADSPWALGFVACKLVHWGLLADAEFPENLASGEDVVFFAQLLRRSNLKLRPVQDADGARYLRTITEGSVSRRDDFEFSVDERLDAIELIRGMEVPEANQVAQQALVKAQAGFIARFHAQHADSPIGRKALDAIAYRGFSDFPWDLFDKGEAKTLVFAYCFPPDADTSSNVMAKRIMNAGDVVDVISNDMRAVREQDDRFYGVIQRWVRNHIVLETPTSFANWDAISSWAADANRVAEESENNYKSIYSRALWIASHVAAFAYKQQHPEVRWIAEFSDPRAWH